MVSTIMFLSTLALMANGIRAYKRGERFMDNENGSWLVLAGHNSLTVFAVLCAFCVILSVLIAFARPNFTDVYETVIYMVILSGILGVAASTGALFLRKTLGKHLL